METAHPGRRKMQPRGDRLHKRKRKGENEDGGQEEEEEEGLSGRCEAHATRTPRAPY